MRLCLLAAAPTGRCVGQYLQMGMDGVGWRSDTDSGPFLYRTVDASQLVSVRVKISSQLVTGWQEAGILVRVPRAIPADAGTENWQSAWSFRDPGFGNISFRSSDVTDGVTQDLSNAGLTASDLTYVRLDSLGGGVFQAYRGSGPDYDIAWTPMQGDLMMPQTQTNAGLASGPLQVGIAAGGLASPGLSVVYDWAEIQTTMLTYRDGFDYIRDFSTQGVVGFNPSVTSGGAIWNAIENASAGGVPTRSGAVPESASLALLSLAALVLTAVRRMRRELPTRFF